MFALQKEFAVYSTPAGVPHVGCTAVPVCINLYAFTCALEMFLCILTSTPVTAVCKSRFIQPLLMLSFPNLSPALPHPSPTDARARKRCDERSASREPRLRRWTQLLLLPSTRMSKRTPLLRSGPRRLLPRGKAAAVTASPTGKRTKPWRLTSPRDSRSVW